MLPWANPSPRPKRHLDWFSVFAQLTAECPYTLQWAAPFPSELPLRMGDLDSDTHLIHGSLGLPESTTQTASRSVQELFGAHDRDRQTTDHITPSITISRNCVVLRCCLITRHRASTSMYSLTFCVRLMSPERHHWKPAVQTAAVMLRTPPSPAGHRPARAHPIATQPVY